MLAYLLTYLMKRTIIFYETKNKKCYIKEFLDSLPKKVFQKITWVLSLIEELPKIPTLYFKKIKDSDNIWECRIKFGSNIYRIFCFFTKNSIIILTHGIIKKSQKLSRKEIEKAENYKNDYLRRQK